MAFCANCGKELPAGVAFCPSCGAPVQPGATATAAASSTPVSGIDALTKDQKAQEYWVKRFIALIIDGLIIFVVVAIIGAFVASAFLFGAGGFAFVGALFGVLSIFVGIILIFYFPIMESMYGATFGKRFLRLKVVSKTGGNPTFVESFIRNVSKIYWLLLLLDVIVGLATSKGYAQKYTDRIAGTSVVGA